MSSRLNSSVRSRCGQCGGNHNLSYYCSSVNTFKRVKDASRMKFLSGLQSKTSQHGSVLLRSDTEIISQPKDGSCLFSSLSSLIGQGTTSSSLRATVVDVIRNDSNRVINGDSISTWIYCDVSKSAHQYAEWIKKSSSWGGGIECAIISAIFEYSIHIYELNKQGDSYLRIASFGCSSSDTKASTPTHCILYSSNSHYDSMCHKTVSGMNVPF